MVRGLVLILAAVTLALASGMASADPNATRQRELIYRLRQDCGSCHGMTLKGGLGPPLLPEVLAGRDDDALVTAILDGRPGTPMAPWRFEVTPAEARWLVERLRAGLGEGAAP